MPEAPPLQPVTPPIAGAATAREQRIARFVLGVVLLGLGLFILQGFLRALVWAAVIAVATWRLYVRAVARFGTGRHNVLLPLLFTVVTTLVVLVPLVVLGYEISKEAQGIAHWISQARQNGVPEPAALRQVPFGQAQLDQWWASNLGEPEGARRVLGRMDAELMAFGRHYGSRIAHTAVNFGFEMLALFFLYRDGPGLARTLLALSRRVFGPHGERVALQMVNSVHGTVDGLVLVGIGIGIVLGIGYVVAGVPHPALLGAFTAVGAMIPGGAWILLALACLLAVAAGHTLAAVVLGVFGLVVVFGADHFIRPAIIGGATKLPFLWVLLGILGGVETCGLLGLFVGPAIMAALILLWREWVSGPNDPAAAA